MTLTEFLLARLAEDEAAARDAYYDGQVWIPEEEAVVSADRDLEPVLFLDRKCDAAHAHRWSPARVLADVEAKRRIVEEHRPVADEVGALFCGTCHDHESPYGVAWPCKTYRAVALPFANHPDYQEAWKP